MRDELYSEEHQKLRKVLRRERLAAGLRQSDVAERTGRSQAYISKFEQGDLRLDVVDFVRLCETIGCDPHEILNETFGERTRVKAGSTAQPNRKFKFVVENEFVEIAKSTRASEYDKDLPAPSPKSGPRRGKH